MNISFLKLAEMELDDAFQYYESIQIGLGIQFQEEIQNSLARIINFPEMYQMIGEYSRRCLVHKFPYSVVYQYRDELNEILVIAIAHLHRRPDYWISRE